MDPHPYVLPYRYAINEDQSEAHTEREAGARRRRRHETGEPHTHDDDEGKKEYNHRRRRHETGEPHSHEHDETENSRRRRREQKVDLTTRTKEINEVSSESTEEVGKVQRPRRHETGEPHTHDNEDKKEHANRRRRHETDEPHSHDHEKEHAHRRRRQGDQHTHDGSKEEGHRRRRHETGEPRIHDDDSKEHNHRRRRQLVIPSTGMIHVNSGRSEAEKRRAHYPYGHGGYRQVHISDEYANYPVVAVEASRTRHHGKRDADEGDQQPSEGRSLKVKPRVGLAGAGRVNEGRARLSAEDDAE
ncbi:hypothetical protein AAVH_11169 [Aphelenchoides avenae]|nr:hypothetical protein AAVH_11169 [Aphelenchus avenae]